MEPIGIILFGAGALIGWWIYDRRRHPFKKCSACKGDGKKKSSWNAAAYGPCMPCGGTGVVRR